MIAAIISRTQQFQNKIEKIYQTVYDLLPNEYLRTIDALGVQKNRPFQNEIIAAYSSELLGRHVRWQGDEI